jgi:pilus assembly protein CpaF
LKLTERLDLTRKKAAEPGKDGQLSAAAVTLSLQLKTRLHSAVIDKLDTRTVTETDNKKVRDRVRLVTEAVVNADAEGNALSPEAKILLVDSILDEIAGLGPLEQLINDPAISDILVNSAEQIFVERGGRLELTTVRFTDNQHLLNIIQRIVSRVGRRVDESSPMVDARLADGSRVNAVVQPIAADGPILSIRRFGKRMISGQDMVKKEVLTQGMLAYLSAAVHSKCNLLVSGGTGSGKTTMLNILSSYIPKHERTITIEDSAELSLQGAHVVRMEARPANIEGKGEVSIRACVRNALRMRPDRVIIGEVRGGEVLDMLQAMNTGHEGSMATVHSNTPKDAVDRLMMMLALSGITLSNQSMGSFIASSVRVVVQVARFPDGFRRITHIAEVGDYLDERVQVKTVFSWDLIAKKFVYHNNSLMEQRFLEHGLTLQIGAENP